MNRIAIITDIHANLPALQASLEAVDAIGVDAVYCGGDLIGYGPHPNEVCGLIEQQREIPAIYGNYDYAIGRDLAGCGWRRTATRGRGFGVLELARAARVQASIGRVRYDAHPVARDVAAAGLPGEYAQELVVAGSRKARKR